MSTANNTSAHLQASFLAIGLSDARRVTPDDTGEIEAIEATMAFVPLVELAVSKALACKYDFPGVFEYEVSQELGSWLHGEMPVSLNAVANKLLKLCREFFCTECAELDQAIHEYLKETGELTFKEEFGDRIFAVANANDTSDGLAQLGIVHDEFVIYDAKQTPCGRFFTDSMQEYQITHKQRDLLDGINSLLTSLSTNPVHVQAAAGIEDPFGLQQKLLAHPEIASKLSGVFAELTLDIIKSEKA
jgi:hypothetical protein